MEGNSISQSLSQSYFYFCWVFNQKDTIWNSNILNTLHLRFNLNNYNRIKATHFKYNQIHYLILIKPDESETSFGMKLILKIKTKYK